ncbi:YybH family protein [Hyphococcus sp.]|jgi:ketosteroid isomerase-like protein|uniref:YybH family protein n=1 Tax=Hyphococcus sp. TaxID=2038636 RepID=UPI003D147E4D
MSGVAMGLLFLSLAACGPSGEGAGDVSDVSGIDQAREQFEAAVAGGDPAAFGALVHPDTVIVQPGSEDWKAMQAAAGWAPFPQGATIDITPLETRVINEEWAYDFGASLVTYPDPETGEEIELRDTYLLILRNTGDGWKPYREVASASPPPAGWPAPAPEGTE